MGTVTRTNTYVAGNTIDPAENNANENTLFTLVNGNIDNDNIKASAGIVSTKIAITDPGSGYTHTGTYDTLDDHIGDASAHGSGISQFERHYYGVVATGTNVLPRWYNKTGRTLTLSAVFIYVETAPTGASLIVDVNKNGTTVFTTQSSRPEIAASGTSDTSGAPDVTSIDDGDYITFDVDQVGSTIPGSDLLIVCYFG